MINTSRKYENQCFSKKYFDKLSPKYPQTTEEESFNPSEISFKLIHWTVRRLIPKCKATTACQTVFSNTSGVSRGGVELGVPENCEIEIFADDIVVGNLALVWES
ncbi:hypothetical protein NPIL_672631 [Nephila pilipes]|uniref:Uncharacterized protein n=1 Tax=Nephila pilipes TaxID=299642 RepID=A0A8X6QFC0_NEPPI|nr:hypothetical protein NPIL_672631 [Nephila pilipes]